MKKTNSNKQKNQSKIKNIFPLTQISVKKFSAFSLFNKQSKDHKEKNKTMKKYFKNEDDFEKNKPNKIPIVELDITKKAIKQ